MSFSVTHPLGATRARNRFATLLVALLTALLSLQTVTALDAQAADATPVQYTDQSFPAASNVSPTEDKPQSKLWYNDGSWWALMRSASAGITIHRLQSNHTWLNTGTVIDSRAASTGDALWDGTNLYVASRASSGSVLAVKLSYSSSTKKYSVVFSKSVGSGSIESVTIAKDSLNRLWVTFTKPDTSNSAVDRVWVAHSTTNDTTWAAPFLVPVSDNTIKNDDISAVAAFGGKVGVLYSDQLDHKVYFAVHPDSSADNAGWTLEVALSGTRYADDHLNVKSLLDDDQGRVYAAVKTSRGDGSGDAQTDPSIAVLSRASDGNWTPSTAAIVSEGLTRPQLSLDKTNKQLYVVMTDEVGGKVYWRRSPLGTSMDFTPRATMISVSGAKINNATTAKAPVDSQSGLVVLASDATTTMRYYHAELSLGGSTPTPPAPTASFTATPTSGTAPLTVQFTDTSTGTPTSWAWDFGDGGTSTSQNPSHTFSAAGTYSVKLTATNANGNNTSAATTITVTAAGGGGGGGGAISKVDATATQNTSATTGVQVSKPAGVTAGDFLIAQITADNNPTMATPTGWTQVAGPISAGTGARVFVFSRVATGSEPASYTFTLSSAQKYNAAMTAFRGVDATNPFDSAAATVGANSGATLTIGGVTTATAGALLVGGVGLNSGSTTVTPPSGWTESVESGSVQTTETASQPRPTAGASGAAKWTLSASTTGAGWMRALRPAA
jgi:PKD repeat protein